MSRKVHLSLANRSGPTIVEVVQYSTEPEIIFILDDYLPRAGAISNFYIEKKSETKIYNACKIDNNTITYQPTTQSFTDLGINKAQLEIVESDSVAISFIILIDVTENIIDSSAIESQDEFTALEAALQTVSSYDGRITTAQNTADAAQTEINTINSRFNNLGDEKLTFSEATTNDTIVDSLNLSTIFGRIKRLFTRVLALENAPQLKTANIEFVLANQTWTKSGGGIFYLAETAAPRVTGATKIYSAALTNQWQGLRTTDIIEPVILPAVNRISLMSTTNTFLNANSRVTVQVVYI